MKWLNKIYTEEDFFPCHIKIVYCAFIHAVSFCSPLNIGKTRIGTKGSQRRLLMSEVIIVHPTNTHRLCENTVGQRSLVVFTEVSTLLV